MRSSSASPISKEYSIRDLEKLSGIKAHTLRIWEQRYNLLQPLRSGTNIRHYQHKDLKKILNVSFLNKQGYKISMIASMSDDEIQERVREISQGFSEATSIIESLFLAMVDPDTSRVSEILNNSIEQSGLENTIRHVAFPLLRKIGTFWQTGALLPAQEHYASNLIRNKIIAGIESLREGTKSETYILYLPQDELHEIALLYCWYLLKSNGYRVVYLGQMMPEADLVKMCAQFDHTGIVTVLTMPTPEPAEKYLRKLRGIIPRTPVYVSGFYAAGIRLPLNIRFFNDGDHLLSFLK